MPSLPAFSDEERATVHSLLALKVAEMMGRKLEEGDWAEVYCSAKRIPNRGWSNLNIDIMHGNLGLEHKMLCYPRDVAAACGTAPMHPSATRSIRIASVDAPAEVVMRDVMSQYGDLIEQRRHKVAEQNRTGRGEDMRTGWLLWQRGLRSFLYFEEPMAAPDPDRLTAQWRESSGGARKASKNLWIYDRETGRKRYSVTTAAGIKIQPYFDVPPLSDPNVCIWKVIGERVDDGQVRVWLTARTATELRRLLGGSLEPEAIADAIATAAEMEVEPPEGHAVEAQVAAVLVPEAAYARLVEVVGGVNDEHSFQLVVDRLLTAAG